MSSPELHQVVFQWPHTEPNTVIVTGTFDEWAASMRLMKIQTGFEGVIQIPWEQKIKYKFVVDGKWLLLEDQPTEVDPGGYVNNTYTAPAKPAVLSALDTTSLRGQQEKSIVVEANNHRTSGDSAEKSGHASAESFTGATNDLASAIAARDGTSSALAVDPINIPQTAIPTPKYNNDFALPTGTDTTSPTVTAGGASSPSPITPLVPIMIVPVNAAENNTLSSSSPPESMHILPSLKPSIPDTTLSDKNDVPVTVTETISEPPGERVNGPSPDTAINIPESVIDTLPIPGPVIQENTSAETNPEDSSTPAQTEADPVLEDPPTERHSAITESVVERAPTSNVENADLPVISETVTTPATTAEIATSQPTEDSAPATNSHFIPNAPTTPHKEISRTNSLHDTQEFLSSQPGSPSQSTSNSPTSSRFNSVRKKRTSFISKIKHIFHHHDHDKEKDSK